MKVAIVNGICKNHDAISESIVGMASVFETSLGAECRFFGYACDSDDLNFVKVDHVGHILTNKFFMEADIIIYHFGIYYELFNAILLGNGHGRQIVYYHNITPAIFLPPSEHRLIKKSEQQIINMSLADEIWAVSEENRKSLESYGLPIEKVKILPLYIKENFTNSNLFKARTETVKILYVGRFVEAKGLIDLVNAVDRARGRTKRKFQLNLVGNQAFSDKKYINKLIQHIADLHLDDIISFSGEILDAELDERLLASDIFATCSYHEGFCVPLIEAMAAGCIPLAYAAGNIPVVVANCGQLVETGDWQAFGDHLAQLIDCFGVGGALPANTQFPINGEKIGLAAMNVRLETHLRDFKFETFALNVRSLIGTVEPELADAEVD